MVIKRVGVVSLGKVLGLFYGSFGFLMGLVLALFALFGAAVGSAASGGSMEPFLGVLFGGGAVIFLPLFYGVMGFLCGLLSGALFNLALSMAGGLEVGVE